HDLLTAAAPAQRTLHAVIVLLGDDQARSAASLRDGDKPFDEHLEFLRAFQLLLAPDEKAALFTDGVRMRIPVQRQDNLFAENHPGERACPTHQEPPG